MSNKQKNTNNYLGKILIVEDEPDVAKYLASLFQDNRFNTITALNGKEGMEIAISQHPDLITLDISMPEESGVRMYKELAQESGTADIPVIIITGLSPDFKRFMDYLGKKEKLPYPAAYFEKPINREEIILKIKEILSATSPS